MRTVLVSVITTCLIFWAGILTAQVPQNISTLNLTISSTTMPWTGGGCGYNDGSAPVTVSSANGFSFAVGDKLTISYVSGLVDAMLGGQYWDANGDLNNPLNAGHGGSPAPPSAYMNPATWPINAGELVGAFVNGSGQILNQGFPIGDLGTFTIPSGATALELGVNDIVYSDNQGSFTINVTESVPEPTTAALILMGLGVTAFALRRRS